MVLENIIRHCMLRNEDNHEDFELINDRNIMSWENYFRIYSWAHQCPAFSNGAAASLSPSTAWSARSPPPSSSTSTTSRGTPRSPRTTPRFVKPWLIYFWISLFLLCFLLKSVLKGWVKTCLLSRRRGHMIPRWTRRGWRSWASRNTSSSQRG